MTKEQAIKVLSESIHHGSKVPWDKIVEAVHLSIEALSQPPLPSNLDEEADDAMFEFYGMGSHLRERPEYVYTYEQMIAMFKAGAEWMAKQGVSMEVVTGVPWRAVDAFIHDHDYTEDSIIQIRKK